MDVNSIIGLARTLTHTDDEQVTDTNAMLYANIVYHDIANAIMEIDEDFFWDIFTTTPIVWQNEYTFAVWSATTRWMKKIERIQIKWADTDSFQTLVNSDTLANYPTTTGRLDTQLGTDEWFFDIKDGSYFIYPAPTEAVTDWLQVQATTTLIDLVLWGAENTVFPRNSDLRDYHQVISIGMKQYIYSQQGLTNDKNDSINEYNQKKEEMLDTIRDRFFNPVITQLPNAYSLKN